MNGQQVGSCWIRSDPFQRVSFPRPLYRKFLTRFPRKLFREPSRRAAPSRVEPKKVLATFFFARTSSLAWLRERLENFTSRGHTCQCISSGKNIVKLIPPSGVILSLSFDLRYVMSCVLAQLWYFQVLWNLVKIYNERYTFASHLWLRLIKISSML